MKKKSSSEFDNPANVPAMAYPPESKVKAAADEMKDDPPAILSKTAKKKGKAQSDKQRVAIMLSKARRGK